MSWTLIYWLVFGGTSLIIWGLIALASATFLGGICLWLARNYVRRWLRRLLLVGLLVGIVLTLLGSEAAHTPPAPTAPPVTIPTLLTPTAPVVPAPVPHSVPTTGTIPVYVYTGIQRWPGGEETVATPRFIFSTRGEGFAEWEKYSVKVGDKVVKGVVRGASTTMTTDTAASRVFEFEDHGTAVVPGTVRFVKASRKSTTVTTPTTPAFVCAVVTARVNEKAAGVSRANRESELEFTLNFDHVEYWKPEDIPALVLDMVPEPPLRSTDSTPATTSAPATDPTTGAILLEAPDSGPPVDPTTDTGEQNPGEPPPP